MAETGRHDLDQELIVAMLGDWDVVDLDLVGRLCGWLSERLDVW